MQFINEDPVHVAIRSEIPAVYDAQGRMLHPKQRRLFAKFSRGTAPGYAQRKGLEAFSFNRIHEGISRERWLAFYDSEEAQQQHGWTDEEREHIEQVMVGQGYVQVEPERLEAPWPKYDDLVPRGKRTAEMVVEKIVSAVEDLGIDPGYVVAYEEENLNRPEVIAALKALGAGGEEEEEPLLAV